MPRAVDDVDLRTGDATGELALPIPGAPGDRPWPGRSIAIVRNALEKRAVWYVQQVRSCGSAWRNAIVGPAAPRRS